MTAPRCSLTARTISVNGLRHAYSPCRQALLHPLAGSFSPYSGGQSLNSTRLSRFIDQARRPGDVPEMDALPRAAKETCLLLDAARDVDLGPVDRQGRAAGLEYRDRPRLDTAVAATHGRNGDLVGKRSARQG